MKSIFFTSWCFFYLILTFELFTKFYVIIKFFSFTENLEKFSLLPSYLSDWVNWLARHITYFYFANTLKWAALSRSSVHYKKYGCIVLDFLSYNYLTHALFFSQRCVFIECSIQGPSLLFLGVNPTSTAAHSLGPWTVASLQQGPVETGFPRRLPISSLTLVMIPGDFTPKDFSQDFDILCLIENSIISYDTWNLHFIILTLRFMHLILILKGNNNLMNPICQTSLKIVSNSFLKNWFPLKTLNYLWRYKRLYCILDKISRAAPKRLVMNNPHSWGRSCKYFQLKNANLDIVLLCLLKYYINI